MGQRVLPRAYTRSVTRPTPTDASPTQSWTLINERDKEMTKAECISRGCPMLVKKTDKVTMLPYWVCGVTNQEIKKVHNCVNKKLK